MPIDYAQIRFSIADLKILLESIFYGAAQPRQRDALCVHDHFRIHAFYS